MLIFGAEMTASPGKGAALAGQVTALRDAAAAATGQDWWAWAVMAGRPYGTFLVSSRFDGMAALGPDSRRPPDIPASKRSPAASTAIW